MPRVEVVVAFPAAEAAFSGARAEPFPALLPAPPEVPRGADPATYRLEVVERAMRSAFFSLFSVPNPATPDVPIEATLPFPLSLLQTVLGAAAKVPLLAEAGIGPLLAAVDVNEGPLRFQTTVGEAACQLLATNTVGKPIATVRIRWTPIPWDYPANPYTNPPQTILNPLASQRFEMLNGEFLFDDSGGTGVHGFGSGRTFPNFPRGLSLAIGAVIDVLEGFGRFAGHSGIMVVNGVITPPNALDLNIMIRILDPSGKLLTDGPLPPIEPQPFPDPTATFMVLAAEPDPDRPSRLRVAADGRLEGIELYERLRAVDLDFAVLPGRGPVSQVRTGKLVGRASSILHFPLNEPVPIPAQTSGGLFELFDAEQGRGFGTLRADLVEGRGLPTPIPGTPAPLYRVGGFGPIQGGSGEFADAAGMLSMNGLLSFFPRTFSNLYIFRFQDPEGRFRRLTASAGG